MIYTAEGDRDSLNKKAGATMRLNRLRQVSQDLFEGRIQFDPREFGSRIVEYGLFLLTNPDEFGH